MNQTVEQQLDMVRAITFGKAVFLFGAIVIFGIFALELAHLYERRKELLQRSKRRKIQYSTSCLLAISFTGLLTIIAGCLVFWLDWTGKDEACDTFSIVTYNLYIILKQVTYLFLYLRLKIVHDALRLNALPVRIMRMTVLLFCTLMVTVVYYPLLIVTFSGIVVPEGTCVQYSTAPYAIMVFAISDFMLSILLLGLFILPLTKHARNTGNNLESRKILRRVARRNLIVSSCMMTSTITMLFFMMQSMMRIEPKEEDPPVTSMQVIHTVFGGFDSIITVVLSHVLSGSWIPSGPRLCFVKIFGSTVRSSKHSIHSHIKSVIGSKNEAAVDAIGNAVIVAESRPRTRSEYHNSSLTTKNQMLPIDHDAHGIQNLFAERVAIEEDKNQAREMS